MNPMLIKSLSTLLLVFGITFLSAHSQTQVDDSRTPQQEKLFIIHFSTGPEWEQDKPFNEQKYSKQHSENLKSLRSEKKILIGARYAEKGMIIIKAADEEQARALIEQDPMIKNKIFTYELHRFHPFYDGCIE